MMKIHNGKTNLFFFYNQNNIINSSQSRLDLYSELESKLIQFMNKNLYYILDNEVLVSNCLEFINAEKIVKESAKAIIRTLPSYRQVNNIFSCFRKKKANSFILFSL